MPIPYASTCSRRSAALATYAENRDCPRCPGNSLSADDEGRSLPNSRARKLTEPIWNGKAKNARRSIKRIRKVMHVFKGELSQGTKGVASRKLWHALHAIDKYLRGQAAWLVNYAKRFRAGERVGTSITEGCELLGQPAHE